MGSFRLYLYLASYLVFYCTKQYKVPIFAQSISSDQTNQKQHTMKPLSSLLGIAFSTLLATGLQAQTTTKGGLKGQVQSGGKGVDAATVALLKTKDSSLVKLSVSNSAGQYELEQILAGQYLLRISAVGYQPSFTKATIVAGETKDAGTTELEAAAGKLQDVVVTVKKPLVEQKLDRTVVNIEGQASNAGITALEVLEKSPGITVDKDGNISLKGKAGVMVLIDGKPTYMSGTDLANYLRNLPSNQLELLEIMTNPPAKYDAAGNAGIINIKTKKNKAKGFNGSFTVGGGQGVYTKLNNSLNLNYRNNKWNLFGNYSSYYNRNFQELELQRVFRNQTTQQVVSNFEQVSNMRRKNMGHNAKLGFDYYASKKTTVGVTLTGFSNKSNNGNTNSTLIMDPANSLTSRTEANNSIEMRFKNWGANANVRHQFDSTGRELTADVDVLQYRNKNDQHFANYFFDKDGSKLQEDEYLRGDLPSTINIYSAKVDYTHPLKGKARFEAGVKTSIVKTDNDARYTEFDHSTGNWIIDTDRSNHFIYTENINAAYVNLSKEFSKKWSGQLGLRAENTNAKGDQLTSSLDFTRSYTQLFPTAYVQYAANEKHSFVLNYGRRIERPDYEDMNPFIYFLDKYTYQTGNPNLTPQFAHNIELSHSFKGFLNTTLNYTRTTDMMSEVFRQDDATNTTFVTKDNVANSRQIGVSINAGVPVTKWWRTNVYVNAFHNKFSGEINGGYLELDMNGWMTNIQNQFTFKKGWGGEISGFYRSRMLEGVLTAQSMGVINFAVTKKMMKDKGQLRLNFRDPFDLQYFRGTVKYQNIDLRIKNQWDNQVLNISFTYRFGKPVKGPSPRKNGGAGDEQNRVKSGGN